MTKLTRKFKIPINIIPIAYIGLSEDDFNLFEYNIIHAVRDERGAIEISVESLQENVECGGIEDAETVKRLKDILFLLKTQNFTEGDVRFYKE